MWYNDKGNLDDKRVVEKIVWYLIMKFNYFVMKMKERNDIFTPIVENLRSSLGIWHCCHLGNPSSNLKVMLLHPNNTTPSIPHDSNLQQLVLIIILGLNFYYLIWKAIDV